MASDPHSTLGGFLTATEAERLATEFEVGTPVHIAARVIAVSRREEAKALLAAAGLGNESRHHAVSVLHAIAGAKSISRETVPVWTMPGNEAGVGHLTSEFHRIIGAARQSVTAATYNFQATSQMWTALRPTSEAPDVVVTVYIDGGVADGAAVKAQLPDAAVWRSATLPSGKPVISHAKFVVVDHELLLITSANFSYSAENRNVEFGVLIHDSALARSVEAAMASKHGTLYEKVDHDTR